MLLVLHPDTPRDSEAYRETMNFLDNLDNVEVRIHDVQGSQQTLTEIYLIGDTKALDQDTIGALPAVERVIRISDDFRILGRHKSAERQTGFDYNGVHFDQDNLNVFAGLCAVDNRQHVEETLRALSDNGQYCTRMGAYKPRTNPYSFQGHGADCLPWVLTWQASTASGLWPWK